MRLHDLPISGHPKQYMDKTQGFVQTTTPIVEDQLAFEFMLNALRLKEGVSIDLFTQRTGLSLETIKSQLNLAYNKGWIASFSQKICTTPTGYQFLNDVVALFSTKRERMNIKIEYEPTAHELTKASSLYAEKKPLLMFAIGFINIGMGLLFAIFLLKLVILGLTPQDWLALSICALWLFGRRPFNEWLLYQRMKRSLVLSRPIIIEISRNGIVWSGKGLRQGHMTWEQVKYILEASNGFVLPNTFTRFLWLPFRGFSSPEELQAMRDIIVEKHIVHRVFPRWTC